MHLIPDWQPLVVNGELQLRREFVFRNFGRAGVHQPPRRTGGGGVPSSGDLA